jgi:hypothetical protein
VTNRTVFHSGGSKPNCAAPLFNQRDSALSKPVDLNVLLQTLARVVNRHYAGHWPVLPTPQQ